MNARTLLVITLLLSGAVACSRAVKAGTGAGQTARAELRDANGQSLGTATLTQVDKGVRIVAKLSGLPPGAHGFHIHAVGQCEPPFTSAGPHFNPAGKKHGLNNPEGPHAGDLPNIDVAADGTVEVDVVASMVTLGEGANALFDADGSALVVHANPDDNVSNPAGNAGARIACGVVSK